MNSLVSKLRRKSPGQLTAGGIMLLIATAIVLTLFGAATGTWEPIEYFCIGMYALVIVGGGGLVVVLMALMLWDAWKD